MYGARPHQHQSLYHTGRGEGKKRKKQGERRRIDIPILPCLLHWPPTLSHIIAADTGKTNDSHVGNMGGWLRKWWRVVVALMGHEMVLCVPNGVCDGTSRNHGGGKKRCVNKTGGTISCEMQQQAHDPELRAQIIVQDLIWADYKP